MIATPAPTDQRAGLKPIAFVLDNVGVLSSPVTLSVRPEELTRTEPSRAAVHQTLGRTVVGWVDNFGAGLPSVTLAGHTGWRHAVGLGMDGAESFGALNKLIARDYHDAKQSAVNRGIDPALVKLLFIDILDDFAWSVVPTQFVLRRSKSRPLLFQYNIAMQALATQIENPIVVVPYFGDPAAGGASLESMIDSIKGMQPRLPGLLSTALGALDSIAASVGKFVSMANGVFSDALLVIRTGKNLVSGGANKLIGIAKDVASVGVNVFRTINAIRDLPAAIKSEIGAIAGAFNAVSCIFSNSLRPRQTYEEYTGLYGSSNCSSTTGGRPPSALVGQNIFGLMNAGAATPSLSSQALAGMAILKGMDSVLAPLPIEEVGRHMSNIVSGSLA